MICVDKVVGFQVTVTVIKWGNFTVTKVLLINQSTLAKGGFLLIVDDIFHCCSHF